MLVFDCLIDKYIDDGIKLTAFVNVGTPHFHLKQTENQTRIKVNVIAINAEGEYLINHPNISGHFGDYFYPEITRKCAGATCWWVPKRVLENMAVVNAEDVNIYEVKKL